MPSRYLKRPYGVIGGAVRAATGLYSMYKRRKTGRTRIRRRPYNIRRTGLKRRYRRKTTTKLTRRRKRFSEHLGTENTYRSLTTSRRFKLSRLVKSNVQPDIFRFQNLSRYDYSSGAIPCSLRSNGGDLILPIHIYDVTRLTQGTDAAPAGSFLYRSSATPWTAERGSLYGQNPDGTSTGQIKWHVEQSSAPYDTVERCFHEYTQIKLNLYGVRSRSTRWLIQLVMVKEELADFYNGSSSNGGKRQLYDYLATPFIFNNLNVGDTKIGKQYLKILRQYEVTLDPMNTTIGAVDDVDGLRSTGVPKMHTLKWFIRHNRGRDFSWYRERDIVIENGAEWPQNYTNSALCQEQVEPKKRVYLMIRAMSPSITNGSMDYTNYAVDENVEPSYDILLRNKWRSNV